MKSKMKKLFTPTVGLIIIAIVFICFANSCSKSGNNNATDANAAFIGTYYGTLVIGSYSNVDTMAIVGGSNGSSIIMNSRTGAGSHYSINGTVSGNAVTIASQSVYVDSYDETFTVSGSGTLSSPGLQVSMKFISPGSLTTYPTFTGTKH